MRNENEHNDRFWVGLILGCFISLFLWVVIFALFL